MIYEGIAQDYFQVLPEDRPEYFDLNLDSKEIRLSSIFEVKKFKELDFTENYNTLWMSWLSG